MSNPVTVIERGMLSGMERLNTISHNLANASTVGFKRDITVSRPFDQVFSAESSRSGFTDHVADKQLGVMRFTGAPLDLAIEGGGYFEVQGSNGRPLYTRRGDFTLDASGRMVTTSGLPLNGVDGEIRLTSAEPRIDKEGKVWAGTNYVGQLRVVTFPPSQQLTKVGDSLYSAAAQSGNVTESKDALRQGYLEASNVNVMQEMVDLITTMRHIEAGQKVMKGYDEMLDIAVRSLGEG